MNEITSFGDWVRQRRKALGLTQAELAKQVDCAVVTVKKIEQDERRPSLQIANLLADRLAVPQNVRDQFIKMGRGQFVSSINFPEVELRPPAFLQHEALSIRQNAPPFVARQRELDLLDRHLEATLSGDGRVVFILGEAGRGKTRLMDQFALQAQESHPGLIVAAGQCNAQSGAGNPYLPFRDVLELLAGDLEARWKAGSITREQVIRIWTLLPHTIQVISEYGPGLIDTLVPSAPLVHRITSYSMTGGAELAQFQALAEQQVTHPVNLEQGQLFEQAARVLQELANRQPLLLLMDDLQWIDSASNQLLFHVGRRLAGSRILILGAYRPSEIALGRPTELPGQTEQHPLEPVINEFKRTFGDIQIDLGRYVQEEGRAFVDAFLDSEPNHLTETFRENLYHHTRGHPLFTVEMLRNMQENGDLVRDESGKWIENRAPAVEELPARVEAVIEQRIHRLDKSLRDLLAAASVEGEIFTAQVAARVLGMDERLVLHRLAGDLDQRHRLVQEHGELTLNGQRLTRYQFGHGLFQEYLYRHLNLGERRLYHREIAGALEDVLYAGRPDLDRSKPTWVYLEDKSRAEITESDLLVMLGPILAHHFWHGQEWLKSAIYALLAGKHALRTYALREAIETFERALKSLELIPDPPPVLIYEAILGWTEAAFKFKPYSEQLRQLAQAEKIARELNDNTRLIRALHWKANVYLARGFWTQAGPALMECLALAGESGDEQLTVRPMYFKALMATFADPPGALTVLEQALALARQYNDQRIEVLSLGTKGQMHAQLGEFSQSQEELRRAYELLPEVDSPLTQSDVDLLAGWSYLAMGDYQHGLEYGQRSVERAIATDNMDCICSAFNCVGFSYLEMQRIPEAESAFAQAIERSQVSGATIPRYLGQAGLAMAQFCSGRVPALQDLKEALEEMQKYQNPVGAASAAQMLGSCLIQRGELDRAESYLNMARDFYQRTKMIPYLSRVLTLLAQLLDQQDRLQEARDIRDEIKTITGG